VEHRIDLALASGAKLTLRLFSDTEQSWEFSYRYRRVEEHNVTLVNDVRLLVRYLNGRVDTTRDTVTRCFPVSLWMHIIIPERLGKQYLYGMDISPGAKTFITFDYDFMPDSDTLQLREMTVGAGKQINFDDVQDRQALVQQINFPFPVPDRIDRLYTGYRVPFLANAGDIPEPDSPWALFEFPLWTAVPMDRPELAGARP